MPHASNPEIHLEFNTKAPEKATHLLAYSTNAFGEHATPGSVELKDAYLPKDKPEGISFEDEDGDKGEVKGGVHIRHAPDTATLDKSRCTGESLPLRRSTSRSHTLDQSRNRSIHILSVIVHRSHQGLRICCYLVKTHMASTRLQRQSKLWIA